MADSGYKSISSHTTSTTMKDHEYDVGTKPQLLPGTKLKMPNFFFHEQNLDDFSTPSFEPPTPPVQSTNQGFTPKRKYWHETDPISKPSGGGHAQLDLFIEPPTPLTQQDIEQFYPALKLDSRLKRQTSLSASNLPAAVNENSGKFAESGNLTDSNRKLSFAAASSYTSPDLLKVEQSASGPITKKFSFQSLAEVFRHSNAPLKKNEPLKVSDLEVHMMSPGSM